MTRADLDRLREKLGWHHELEPIELPAKVLTELLDIIDRLEARVREADLALAAASVKGGKR